MRIKNTVAAFVEEHLQRTDPQLHGVLAASLKYFVQNAQQGGVQSQNSSW